MSLADEDKQALLHGPIGRDNPKWEKKEVLTIRQLAQFFMGYFPDDDFLRLPPAEAYANNKLLDEEEDKILSCLVSKEFSHAGHTINAGTHYMNKLAILAWYEFLGEDCPPVLLPKAMKNIICSLRNKINKLEDNAPSCYLDPENDFFCPEIQLALDVCEAMHVKELGNLKESLAIRVEKYINDNYSGVGKNLIKNLQSLCNTQQSKAKKRKNYSIRKK